MKWCALLVALTTLRAAADAALPAEDARFFA